MISTASSFGIGRAASSQYRAVNWLAPTRADRKDARTVRIESGILTHQVEHGVDAGFGGLFDACLDLRFAHDVGLEHKAEALGVVVDEVEERLDRGADTLFVVRRRSQGLAYTRDEAVDVTLQDCDVQFEFAWEMLVQNWLADTGTFGDLVHAGRVVPVRNEYLTCSCEELEAARIAGRRVLRRVPAGLPAVVPRSESVRSASSVMSLPI